MKGARALLGGILILAAVCTVPAVSAAQDSGSAGTTTTTGTEPPAPQPPASEPSAPPDPTITPSSHDGGAKTGDGGGGGGQASSQQSDSSQPATTSTRTDRRAHASAATPVTMKDFLFSPATVTIHAGDIVTWHNAGKQPHTATADDGSFDTGTLTSGQSASHMFTQPGTFTYYCTIHPNMHGTVRVLGASGGGGSGGSGGSGATASSSATGPTEAQAVASPDAAGDKNSLAATGMAAGALALVGFCLLASGLVARVSGRRAAASITGKQLTLF